MPFELSFSPEFFMAEGDDEILPQDMQGEKPVSVWQAIMAMSYKEYNEMAVDIFGKDGSSLDPLMVLEKIQETRTCTNLKSPVNVWIDEDGYYRIDVWEDGRMTMTKTEEVLAEMMRENTGTHFLDSGSAYGRNWEKNQNDEFLENTDPVIEGGISVSIPTYGFLRGILEYDEDMDRMFESFCEGKDDSYLSLMDEFAKKVNGTGLYGDGGPITVNSYNHDSALTQVIQYIYWKDNDNEGHVLLQIHGGCDVRGGYTKPRAFKVRDDGVTLLDNGSRAHIYCNACEAGWNTEDAGCTWEPENEDTRNLEDCIVSKEEPKEYLNKSWVRVDGDKFHCPVCGDGVLSCQLY